MRNLRCFTILMLAAGMAGGAAGFPQSLDPDGPQVQVSSIEEALAQTGGNPLDTLDAMADVRMRRVVKILRTSDKAQVNQFVPLAFTFEHVNPFAVIRFIRRVIDVEEGNFYTFVAPDNESGVLLVNVPLWQVQPFTELVELIDRPGLTTSSGSKKVYIRTKHRDPTDPGVVAVITVLMTGDTKVIADVATGAIFVSDAPSGYEGLLNFIDEVDVATPQILLRAKIYEIDLTDDGTIGLDYMAWQNGPGRNLFAAGAFTEGFRNSRLSVNGVDGIGRPIVSPGVNVFGLPNHRFSSSGANAAYFYDVPSAFFDYLVARGRARIMTAPRASVMHAQTARFSVGDDILFYRVQNGPAAVAGVRPDGLVLDPFGDSDNFPDNRTVTGALTARVVAGVAETGVTLTVTPIIGEESIDLDVAISVVSQLGFDDSGAPMLSSRFVNTHFRVEPGREYIIGGLTRTREIQVTQKMPILGSIPVIGWLFGGETTTHKKTMLAITLTAEVIDDFSGLNGAERRAIESVESPGMQSVELPGALLGFDMMLMGRRGKSGGGM